MCNFWTHVIGCSVNRATLRMLAQLVCASPYACFRNKDPDVHLLVKPPQIWLHLICFGGAAGH